jgi:hypothetical protein
LMTMNYSPTKDRTLLALLSGACRPVMIGCSA